MVPGVSITVNYLAGFGWLLELLNVTDASRKVWNEQRTFKRMGIPTPPFKFFFGHYLETFKKVR